MITIGIMTGNSLDGVDAVITEFNGNDIKDIAGVSLPYTDALREDMLHLRQEIIALGSDMEQAALLPLFKPTLKKYTDLVIEAVEILLEKSGVKREDVAAIGLHGQSTGAHNPPSVAGLSEPFTTQIFDAAKLAKATQIPVVYDFRSDDIFNGGEGAPLAPMHNRHLSQALEKEGLFPVLFINGGNTANLSLVTTADTLRRVVTGFDCGPFNHYTDGICKLLFNENFDKNGELGAPGQINNALLRDLYNESALTDNGANFLELLPPKSAGPHLYNMLDKLKNYPMPREDILRTVEYFSAYVVFLSLAHIPEHLDFPRHFVLFGGGWKNPLIYRDFTSLLHGRGYILPEHAEKVEQFRKRFRNERFFVSLSDNYNISSQFMEARIFADMAYCFLTGKKFTAPEITGCKTGTVCGIICEPGKNTRRKGRGYQYSRAAKGWSVKA